MIFATHYLKSATQQKSTDPYRQQGNIQDVDLEFYGLRNVDRFSVLYDLWECEDNFNQKKRQLFDCYLEAYHHVTGADATKLAQVSTLLVFLMVHTHSRIDSDMQIFHILVFLSLRQYSV